MKTALEQILETLDKRIVNLDDQAKLNPTERAYPERINELRYQYKMIHDLLPAEKEQIANAYDKAVQDCAEDSSIGGVSYFNETFETL